MKLKRRLIEKQITLGSWITLAHPAIAEIMARAGFDWLVIDLEHSVITIREAEDLIRIIDLCGVVPLVRLSANDAVQIKRVMDAGAHGVIVPMVNTRNDAEHAVRAVRYPPSGTRGVGLARAQGYGPKFEDYKKWLQSNGIVIVQIEHILAVDNLEAILTVDGVDAFMVGPYDLSGSLGTPGQFDSPGMTEALREIQRVSARLNVSPGYHVVPPKPELVEQKLRDGYKFIAYSTDVLMLGETCRNDVSRIRQVKE